MKLGAKRLLVCDCEGTMPLDGAALAKACRAAGGEGELELNTQLCRAQLDNFQHALGKEAALLVGCTQEAPLFSEIAAEARAAEGDEAGEGPALAFVNIRERAGWSDEAAQATPKIAALLAEAAVEVPPTRSVELKSEGVCLVYGRDEQALEAAKQLAGRLEVTVLLDRPGEILPPDVMDVPIFRGRIREAKGRLGAFGVTVDGYAAAVPSARHALTFERPRDGAFSECDLILDLSGGTPLFQAPEKRDGYLRPDPGDPVAVQKALFEIADMVGEYEKPLYVHYDAEICVHARNQKVGCNRCLDVCPTGAITSAGDQVAIDPFVCAGCGSCASVCPTGAATYQYPPVDALFERLRVLLSRYREAGGESPVLLLHDGRHGHEAIALLGRAGRGLPADVLPFAVNEVTQVGLDFLSAALAYGAGQICILADPRRQEELAGLAGQIGLVEAIMDGLGYGGGRIHVFAEPDPEKIETALYDLQRAAPPPAGSFLTLGGKRTRSLLALRHLHDNAPQRTDVLALPPGAPFGEVTVDTAGCTMCLACVSACPTGALKDDPDRPWLGFNEEACVQCGLCRVTCPESVIALAPRLNFTEEARGTVVKNRQEPFLCIRCGRPFGVQATIEYITERLAGKNPMFAGMEQVERIMMCDDCRVIAQFDDPNAPLRGPERPRTRTTDDDLREREIEQARAKLLADRAKDGGDGGNGTGSA